MKKEDLKLLHTLNGCSDIAMLDHLKTCCNDEDLEEVELLIYLNDTVGIGWGKPTSAKYEKEFQERESEYIDRKKALLKKYDSEESWAND